jgi:cytochrome c556
MRFERRQLFLFVVAMAAVLCGIGFICRADEPPSPKGGVRPFMRVKLEASNKILEGLATEDFRLVREGARTLHTMSGAEKWRVSNDPLYRQYSAEFNRQAERLLEKANERNLDGATLAWVECTMSCVRCHKYARAIKIAGPIATGSAFGPEVPTRR